MRGGAARRRAGGGGESDPSGARLAGGGGEVAAGRRRAGPAWCAALSLEPGGGTLRGGEAGSRGGRSWEGAGGGAFGSAGLWAGREQPLRCLRQGTGMSGTRARRLGGGATAGLRSRARWFSPRRRRAEPASL